jgi:hypothetical protein
MLACAEEAVEFRITWMSRMGHSQQIEREPKSVNVRFAPNAT